MGSEAGVVARGWFFFLIDEQKNRLVGPAMPARIPSLAFILLPPHTHHHPEILPLQPTLGHDGGWAMMVDGSAAPARPQTE